MYIRTYMYNIVVNYFTIQKINCLFFVVKHCTVINENIVLLKKEIKVEGGVTIVFIFAQENVHMIQHTCRKLVNYRGMLCILSI